MTETKTDAQDTQDLKPQFLEEAVKGTYRFCAARECPIVYLEIYQFWRTCACAQPSL
jgi:hypothetical protein